MRNLGRRSSEFGPMMKGMHFVNKDAVMHSDDFLYMVHQRNVLYNLDENDAGMIKQGPGEPVWRTEHQHIVPYPDPCYQQTGSVLNVRVYASPYGSGPGNSYVASLSVCEQGTCSTCFSTADEDGHPPGLPFCHSKNVWTNNEGNFYFHQNLTEEPPNDLILDACEKKTVMFMDPLSGIVGEPAGLNVVVAVCVPTSCSACRPPDYQAPPPGPPPGTDHDTTMAEVESGEQDYQVQYINGSHHLGGGRFEYRVKWVDDPIETWEPIEYLVHLPDFIWHYHEEWPRSPRPGAALVAQYGLELPPKPPRVTRPRAS